MKTPRSTYRLQFNANFTFNNARSILDYLEKLGISDIYASPIFKARKGSTHGYDVVNNQELNPDIGTRVEFEHLMETVQAKGLGWLQDIVPNHMAIDSGNEFLMDILENGPASAAYNYFDIDWEHPYESLRGKLLLPILGDLYKECLEGGQIKLTYEREGFFFNYYEHRFPLKIETYANVLSHRIDRLKADLGNTHSGLIKLLGVLYIVKNLNSATESEERKGQVSFAKTMLWELCSADSTIAEFIDENLTEFNGKEGDPSSFSLLDALHSEQFFKLSYWKVATEELNYRRFFTVNDLISVRAEDEHVFVDFHALILSMANKGVFTGLRIDHIDGLYNPRKYLERLRNQIPDLYLIVEKILAHDEYLRGDWPVQGTTGYDFMNMVSQMMSQSGNEKRFEKLYKRFSGEYRDFNTLLLEKKRLIINRHMAGDIDNLALLIKKVSSTDRRGTDMTMHGLRSAIIELLAFFPVYRTYIHSGTLNREDIQILDETFFIVKKNNPAFIRELEFIEHYLYLRLDPSASEHTQQQWLNIIMRFQQFSGPLMAKGLEDTTLYDYNRLISLNEVGGYPDKFGVQRGAFHKFNQKRFHLTPHTLNATSTHDTKRGEDARMRIGVLSEIPNEWERMLKEFARINKNFKKKIKGELLPDGNDEIFLYQTLLGSWPFEQANFEQFIERIQAYTLKAAREAKVHTEWIKPDEEFENILRDFINSVLDRQLNKSFFDIFIPFQEKIAWYGVRNSLSQLILKCCSPGVPDLYQGTELWDLNLVDPDNRRPVDYDLRSSMLSDIAIMEEQDYCDFLTKSLSHPENGAVKLFLLHQLLKLRNSCPTLFECGSYAPLRIEGEHKNHLVAFSRHHNDQYLIAVVPRLLTNVYQQNSSLSNSDQVWSTTAVEVPASFPNHFKNVLTGKSVDVVGADSTVGELFKDFPGAVLFGCQ
ncbi:malto-oligosyltrehalose synthase [Chitinispirillales bacterium ANBcel5]|uniref:malto-oligosyltrehalose synthase n=1 Tax=Cellulosispirillum alkaliphilum TaxID=3039283 RepID=UPI002A586AD5|nr:malto-oligosyltrehalose synthase [Chitinispirillales bacterium ANBcel5]